jgi:hypothetical protein
MNLTHLLYRRVLMAAKRNGFDSTCTVEEFTILEISPSGKFIKIRNMDGRKYWKVISDIQIIETLETIEKSPGPCTM